jgi:hypothetical protein
MYVKIDEIIKITRIHSLRLICLTRSGISLLKNFATSFQYLTTKMFC